MEPIEIPIDGVLDLHTFNPKELPHLLNDYLSACREKGIMSIRIVHGKGTGVQKARVRSLLSKNPMVIDCKDAPEQQGGWGATVVRIR
jgi:DNA-nicking Smr family endonuclease